MLLQSGDFEAYDSQRPTLPPPPRAPVFNRVHAAPPAGGFGWNPYAQNAQTDGHSYGPPAPGSLAPTAMAAYDTGSHRPGAPTIVIRSKPTVKWGVGIAIAGALIGGILGVTMRNETLRRAAASAQAANDMTPPPTTPTTTVAQSIAGPTTIPSQPPQTPPQALAASTVIAPAAPIVIAPPPQEPKEPKAKPRRFFTFHAPPPPPSRPSVVATKVTPQPPPPTVKEKPLAKDSSDAAELLKRAKQESGSSL
jgi:hypothetical protein